MVGGTELPLLTGRSGYKSYMAQISGLFSNMPPGTTHRLWRKTPSAGRGNEHQVLIVVAEISKR
jgi:hypothetical protein